MPHKMQANIMNWTTSNSCNSRQYNSQVTIAIAIEHLGFRVGTIEGLQ
jgi:hypothetical protein